jgi:3-oxoadipyl-CoA thiolase
VEEVFLGCANQAGEDNRDIARMAALLAGLPVTVPGVTFNRLCASGMDAVGTAARAIKLGEIDLAIAGGVESMSRAPFVMGKSMKPLPVRRSLAFGSWASTMTRHTSIPMGERLRWGIPWV